MANGVGGPQRNKRVQEFVELCAAAAKRSACGLVLLRRPADTESWQQPTSADHVDTRQLPGELNGWIPRSDEHAAAQLCGRGRGSGHRQRDERIQIGPE